MGFESGVFFNFVELFFVEAMIHGVFKVRPAVLCFVGTK